MCLTNFQENQEHDAITIIRNVLTVQIGTFNSLLGFLIIESRKVKIMLISMVIIVIGTQMVYTNYEGFQDIDYYSMIYIILVLVYILVFLPSFVWIIFHIIKDIRIENKNLYNDRNMYRKTCKIEKKTRNIATLQTMRD